MPERVRVSIDGHQLELSNLDKVLYPETGFTKGEVIDYYVRVAPYLLPHLAGSAADPHPLPERSGRGQLLREEQARWDAGLGTHSAAARARLDERPGSPKNRVITRLESGNN